MVRIVLFLLFPIVLFSQKVDSLKYKICLERGHIESNYICITLLYCPSYIIDLPDKTLSIVDNPNIITCRCERCGDSISRRAIEKPDTTIIWRKNE